MVRDHLRAFEQSVLGLALHIIVQLVVVCGLPTAGYFALQIIDHSERIIRLEESRGVQEAAAKHSGESLAQSALRLRAIEATVASNATKIDILLEKAD